MVLPSYNSNVCKTPKPKNSSKIVVVSEQIGVAKPDRKVFDYAFSQMDDLDKTKILMVGDTLELPIF